jgi:hypothetical protein
MPLALDSSLVSRPLKPAGFWFIVSAEKLTPLLLFYVQIIYCHFLSEIKFLPEYL